MNKATATETANEMSSDELAQQLSDGNQFNFNSPMKGRNEIE